MTAPGPLTRPRQLTLALPHRESRGRDDFLESPSNAAALALVESWPDWADRAVALVGPEGAGKSHLAAIFAEIAGARLISAHTLDEAGVPAAVATGALVLEDAGEPPFDEAAMFHLLNLVRETRSFLLVTARRRPATWAVTLPDLVSRLRAVPVVEIDPPDDQLIAALMVKLFADRQVVVDPGVVEYLAPRLPRSFLAVRALVDRLDAEALGRGRPVTRTLAAEVLRPSGA